MLNTNRCQGGEPMDVSPCAKCGATENDICGDVSGDTYKSGLEVSRLREVLEDTCNALRDRRDQEKGKNAVTLMLIRNIETALATK